MSTDHTTGLERSMDGIPNPRVRNLLTCIREDKTRIRHMLFYGPPGSGKTSTARLFIESWYEGGAPPPGSTLFLNASDERGLESIRNRVFPVSSESEFTCRAS